MKFSCCTNLGDIEALKALKKHGYTGYETPFSALTDMSAAKVTAFAETANKLDMKCVAHNCMFGEISLLKGSSIYNQVKEYLDQTFEKSKLLGSKLVVLGSGGAREIPDGMSPELATERFCALICDVIAPLAEKYGYIIAIEELRREECNFINSCREAMEIVRTINRPSIGLLVDYYHAMLGGDKLSEIASYGDAIKHVHLASPKNNRHFPNIDDLSDCRLFFAALKAADYRGMVSLEGNDGGNFESAIAEASSVMKAALED